MTDPSKIKPTHTQRAACVYIRQSTPGQVEHNRESTARRRVGGGAPGCPGAGHRPPLKRGVRFSRATLSRRRPFLGCNRRN